MAGSATDNSGHDGTTGLRRLADASWMPHLSVCLSVTLLGSSFVAARAMMEHSDAPATMAFLRYLLAALCLVPLTFGRRHWRIGRGDVIFALAIGMLQFGLFHLFVNTALQEIPAARGAVIFALIPILTMLFAAAGGRDRITGLMAFAAVLSFFGVALAVGEKALSPSVGGGSGLASLWGEGLFFLAVCCGAFYNAFSARLYSRHSVAAISLLAMMGGTVLQFPFAVAEGMFARDLGYDGTDWALLVYLAVMGGTVSMLLFNWGLRRLAPAGAAIWVPISPIAATVFGAIFLDEQITLLLLVGLACAVAGPVLVNRARRAATTPASAGAVSPPSASGPPTS